jgi:hypothetical protein
MTDQGETTSKNLSVFETFVGIFTNPQLAFQSVKANPNWLFPVMILIIVGIVLSIVLSDINLDLQKQAILDSERIQEDQKDIFLTEFENPSFMREYGFGFLGIIFYYFAGFSIAALALMVVGNFILGGQTSFKENYALMCWGGLIGIVASIVKVPLMLSKNSIEVYTSLAILMDGSQSKTFMFKLLNAIDVFAIWQIIVLSIGFSVIYSFSKGKSYAAVISLYVIYTLGAIGISQLVGGFF